MKKRIATHQPNYIPWLGFFYKIYKSNIFVFLDDVQFIKKGMHNYHNIKTPQGLLRLKIPVVARYESRINEVITKDELKWKEEHLSCIKNNYSKSQYFNEVYYDISNILLHKHKNLADLNIEIIVYISRKFGFKTEFIRSSDLGIDSTKEQRIVEICKKLDASIYYSGKGAKVYQNETNFIKNGIALEYSDFEPFEYPQLWGAFQSNVTVIDYLMNCGYDWERVIKSNGEILKSE